MKITQLSVTNFRLLDDVSINIEDDITFNCWKTIQGRPLFEIINLFLKVITKSRFMIFLKIVMKLLIVATKI